MEFCIMENIGAYLKKIRKDAGISLKKVYQTTGVSDSILSRIENGTAREPSPFDLRKLANFYNVSLIGLYKKAGYLTDTDLNSYQHFFSGIDALSEEEKAYIQNGINLLNKK